MVPYDTASFAAGQNCGTRIASCIARLAASELMQDARWWNRRRRGAMARALFAYSEDLENDADSAHDNEKADLLEGPATTAAP